REVRADKPAREASFELQDSEQAKTFRLVAIATDGRQTTTLVPAGASSVSVEFAAPHWTGGFGGSHAGSQPGKPPSGAHAWGGRAEGSRGGGSSVGGSASPPAAGVGKLAPSPYEK